MIKTRVCELFEIEHPIVQGGMIWTSGHRLASAVSRAGGLGLVGAGSMRPDLLREHIRKTRTGIGKKPYGVNLPIFNKYADAMASVIIEEGVRIVFTSGGSPKKYTPTFKCEGIIVAHVCSTPTQAKKCEDAGVDAVVVEGFEAGGHDGPDQLTTMALVPQARDLVEKPILAAGGVYEGRTMAAALMLGADGVQVGSRFAASTEASCHENFKRSITKAKDISTRMILNKLVPVRALMNPWGERVRQAEIAGATADELRELLGKGRSRRGMFEGELEEGELEIGQASGGINDIRPAGDLLREMVEDCQKALSSYMP